MRNTTLEASGIDWSDSHFKLDRDFEIWLAMHPMQRYEEVMSKVPTVYNKNLWHGIRRQNNRKTMDAYYAYIKENIEYFEDIIKNN